MKVLLAPVMTMFVLFPNFSIASAVWASGNSDKEINLTEKVKINVSKIGTGTDARITVKLKDGTKI